MIHPDSSFSRFVSPSTYISIIFINLLDLKFSPCQQKSAQRKCHKKSIHATIATVTTLAAGVSKSSKLTSKSEEKRNANEEAQRKAQGRGSAESGTTWRIIPNGRTSWVINGGLPTTYILTGMILQAGGMVWGWIPYDPAESEFETIQVSRHPTKPQEVLGCPRRLVNG